MKEINQEVKENLATMPNCVPPLQFTRNQFGLLTHINYTFSEDGLINWRKLIKPEFLVPNKEKTQETDVTKLNDNQLLILLGGLKELAFIRGYTSINSKVCFASLEAVTVETQIEWTPNFEVLNEWVSSCGIATATLNNTESFARNYLSEIAENRSFCRCVRNFLRINICSKEEVGPNKYEVSTSPDQEKEERLSRIATLKSLMEEKNISMEKIKARGISNKIEGAENWVQVEDIPLPVIFEFIGRLKKYQPKGEAENNA